MFYLKFKVKPTTVLQTLFKKMVLSIDNTENQQIHLLPFSYVKLMSQSVAYPECSTAKLIKKYANLCMYKIFVICFHYHQISIVSTLFVTRTIFSVYFRNIKRMPIANYYLDAITSFLKCTTLQIFVKSRLPAYVSLSSFGVFTKYFHRYLASEKDIRNGF